MICVLGITWITLLLGFVTDCNSHTLLLATGNGVKILNPATSTLTTVHEHPASAVDFRYNKNDVFFVSNNQILYSYYSEYTAGYADPIPIITTTHKLSNLVIDWKAFKLYYSGGNTSAIYKAALLGSTISPLILTSPAEVRDLAVDVYDRRFFYIKGDTLYVSFLQMKEDPSQHFAYKFITDTHRITSVAKVAVDHHTREVYVVGYDNAHLQWHLVSTDYNNTESSLVFNGIELAKPFALEVFDREIIWGSLSDGKYTIYSCKLTPACDIDHLEIIHQSSELISDVKFYNNMVQTPDTEEACRELACSHNCTIVSLYQVRCSCPPGLTVEPDGNICRETPPTELSVLWTQEIKRFLAALADEIFTSMTSMTQFITTLILISCVIMLALLICGLCLLMCARRPKRSVDLSEAHALSETRPRTEATDSSVAQDYTQTNRISGNLLNKSSRNSEMVRIREE